MDFSHVIYWAIRSEIATFKATEFIDLFDKMRKTAPFHSREYWYWFNAKDRYWEPGDYV